MARLSWLILCVVGALLGGCAYGVDDAVDADATAEDGAPLEAAQPAAAADTAPRETRKPQPDPWGHARDPRQDAEQIDVDPGKPQPDPWHEAGSTAATVRTTNSK